MREKNVFALIIGLIVICVAVVGLFSLISSTNTVNTSNQNNSTINNFKFLTPEEGFLRGNMI